MIFLNINKKNYNISIKKKIFNKKFSSKIKLNSKKTAKNVKKQNYYTPIEILNSAIKSGKYVFLFAHMETCGPCIATRPEWEKMCNVLREKYKNKYNNVVIADIDHTLLDRVKLKETPSGFPSMRFICDKGRHIQDYEKSDINAHDRSVDSFVEWIESIIKKHNISMSGGFVYGEKKHKKKTITYN
jgi:guanylate kinase